MTKAINLDMDGTIADLYSVSGWLADLEAENVRPYAEAKPMVNFSVLARVLNKKQREGWTINIISWLSKNSTEQFDEAVSKTKIEWLSKHLPSVHFDTINIVKYGTPKSLCGSGVLFDDEERNRKEWKGTAYDVSNILTTLRSL